jgi:hypothetical protein
VRPSAPAAHGTPAAHGAPPAHNAPAADAARAERAGTKRKSVVFEEDDELDVPDFLK